ncbi:RNA polymerase sigma factor [Micromonospora sp. NPDC048830]|uniref:RNA polymerase sigma factor n=1 Tax=Micromonospora sp. NPDC048830 TaxID=3364257 RepID=UPI0037107F10
MRPGGDECDEHALIERARAGDLDAFGSLYDRYRVRLTLMVVRWLAPEASYEVAEDLACDALLCAYRSLRQYDAARASFWTWLNYVAMSVVRNHKRSKRRKPEMPAGFLHEYVFDHPGAVESAEAAVLRRLDSERVVGVLRSLMSPGGAVLALRFMEGFTQKETGALLGGLTAKQVERRQMLARAEAVVQLAAMRPGRSDEAS